MWPSKTYTFSPSTTIASAKINQNFDDLLSGINTAMPSGGIIIWSGAVASIPSGWYLCDGNNSTPDLRGKFIIGAGGAYTKGSVGGSETINIAHTHGYSGNTSNNSDMSNRSKTNDLMSCASDPHYHSYSGTTGSGLSTTQSILPPYFALAYIMKS